MSQSKPALVIVIPCYNEEEVLPETAERLSGKILQLISAKLISQKSFLLFVDDGSKDNTWTLIEKYHKENPLVFSGIKLARNSGHQNALLCGLLSVKDKADVTVSIDADLQNDINVIDQMLIEFLSGCEIVYGVRSGREGDSFFKKTSARFFYRFMRFCGSELIYNHSEFRLMSRKALNALAGRNVTNPFLRGIVPTLGLKSATVCYDIKKRHAGKSKFTLRKMLWLAYTGITSCGIIGKYKARKNVKTKQNPGYHVEKIL